MTETKKDIMPTNGLVKPFVGINLAKKDSTSVDIFDKKWTEPSPTNFFGRLYKVPVNDLLIIICFAFMPARFCNIFYSFITELRLLAYFNTKGTSKA